VADATEEAIINALFMAESFEGIDGRIWEAVSPGPIVRLLSDRGLLS
jgi:hypothetical protein